MAASNQSGFTATAVGGLVLLHVFDSVVFDNQKGFAGNNAGSNVIVGNSAVSQNAAAWVGNVFSFQGNYVIQNGGNDPPAPGGTITKK